MALDGKMKTFNGLSISPGATVTAMSITGKGILKTIGLRLQASYVEAIIKIDGVIVFTGNSALLSYALGTTYSGGSYTAYGGVYSAGDLGYTNQVILNLPFKTSFSIELKNTHTTSTYEGNHGSAMYAFEI
jgi:drug/metabolite transporter superfamily protein YnfA